MPLIAILVNRMTIKINQSIGLLSLVLFILSCQQQIPHSAIDSRAADIIFVGDHIITVDDSRSDITAVAVAGQDILATGKKEDILKLRNKETQIIELGEHALVPGFIDAHGHMTSVAKLVEVIDLTSPPGSC